MLKCCLMQVWAWRLHNQWWSQLLKSEHWESDLVTEKILDLSIFMKQVFSQGRKEMQCKCFKFAGQEEWQRTPYVSISLCPQPPNFPSTHELAISGDVIATVILALILAVFLSIAATSVTHSILQSHCYDHNLCSKCKFMPSMCFVQSTCFTPPAYRIALADSQPSCFFWSDMYQILNE